MYLGIGTFCRHFLPFITSELVFALLTLVICYFISVNIVNIYLFYPMQFYFNEYCK